MSTIIANEQVEHCNRVLNHLVLMCINDAYTLYNNKLNEYDLNNFLFIKGRDSLKTELIVPN